MKMAMMVSDHNNCDDNGDDGQCMNIIFVMIMVMMINYNNNRYDNDDDSV